MFRIFIDEFGHNDMRSSHDPQQRYLGLTGVIFSLPIADGEFTNNLNQIKQDIFGRSDFALHRREILDASPAPFTVLADAKTRSRFGESMLVLMEKTAYRVITVIIDKKEHNDRYSVWHFEPYHYCMTAMLERYGMMLRMVGSVGDVMVESRGKKDNIKLAKAYQYIWRNGTENLPAQFFQRWLSSKDIKIKNKVDNIAGLQLADLIANPSCRELICARTQEEMTAGFGSRIVAILYKKKYRRSTNGKVLGWGTKWLP